MSGRFLYFAALVLIPQFTSGGGRMSPGYAPANIVFHNFNDGTDGGVWDDLTIQPIDYPNDPTGSGRGKVCRIQYSPGAGPASHDANVVYDSGAVHYGYGQTIWFKGDLYLPSTLSDGTTPKTTQQKDDVRKLIDYFMTPPWPRLIIELNSQDLVYVVCQVENDLVFHGDITIGNTGITLLFDTWYTTEVRLTLNSAQDVEDGVLEIFVNNPGAIPDFSLTAGIQMIRDATPYINSFRFGTQLTTYGGFPGYSEYRYWDNVGLSTTRIA